MRKERKSRSGRSRADQCILLRAFALGFCGVPSTKTIGLFACVWVAAVAAAIVVVVDSASTLAGGAAFRRGPLNTLDMLTSRCSTLRVLGSARRMSASCSREAERERERDSTKLRVVDLRLGRTWESGNGGGELGRMVDTSCPSESPSSSDEDVHCGIRKSFLRKSLYCSGSFWANLNQKKKRNTNIIELFRTHAA